MICATRYLEKMPRRSTNTSKHVLAIQDPLKSIPPELTHPNFKVDPFLAGIQTISMAAWDMGRDIFCDEQTIGFKGNHSNKQRISYKKEGNKFLQIQFCKTAILTLFTCKTCQHQRTVLTISSPPSCVTN